LPVGNAVVARNGVGFCRREERRGFLLKGETAWVSFLDVVVVDSVAGLADLGVVVVDAVAGLL
jgi:hypothetical protein